MRSFDGRSSDPEDKEKRALLKAISQEEVPPRLLNLARELQRRLREERDQSEGSR